MKGKGERQSLRKGDERERVIKGKEERKEKSEKKKKENERKLRIKERKLKKRERK